GKMPSCHHDEPKKLQPRFWISACLTALIVGLPNVWVQAACATPIVFWGAFPFYTRAMRALNMFTLISLGILAAYAYSVASLFSPHVPYAYFETAAAITVLVLLGQIVEGKARARTSNAIEALLRLSPKTATLIRDNKEQAIALEQVKRGDTLCVHPGE